LRGVGIQGIDFAESLWRKEVASANGNQRERRLSESFEVSLERINLVDGLAQRLGAVRSRRTKFVLLHIAMKAASELAQSGDQSLN
jgi:hypothetical protein